MRETTPQDRAKVQERMKKGFEGDALRKGKHVLHKATMKDVLDSSAEEIKPKILKLMDKAGISGIAIFVCDDPMSLFNGTRKFVRVGPEEAVRSFDDCVGRFIGRPDSAYIAMYYVPKA